MLRSLASEEYGDNIIESLADCEDGEVNNMDQRFTPNYLRVSLLMAAIGLMN